MSTRVVQAVVATPILLAMLGGCVYWVWIPSGTTPPVPPMPRQAG